MENAVKTQMYTSVNVTIYFNAEMDDLDVKDFVESSLEKYRHPDHVIRDYEYWHSNES
jgi:hypothetical protein